MKIEELKNAVKAQSIIESLDKNINIAETAIKNISLKFDGGGIAGQFDIGYGCFVSEYSDYSGPNTLNLNGCYVVDKVYSAVLEILKEQRKSVVEYLTSIGVEL